LTYLCQQGYSMPWDLCGTIPLHAISHSSCNGQHNVQFVEIIRGVTWQSEWNFLNPLSPKLLML
jgi:hypothetical protein